MPTISMFYGMIAFSRPVCRVASDDRNSDPGRTDRESAAKRATARAGVGGSISIGVVPPVVCRQPDDVAEVRALEGYRILVSFHDGTSGTVDLKRLIASENSGVFAELRDPEIFAKAEVRLGTVGWPGDIDLAPDAMYAALRTSGEWILG